MNSFFERIDFDLEIDVSSDGLGDPQCFVVVGSGIEAVDDINFAQSFPEVLEIGLNVVAGLLVSFHYHYDAWVK